MQRDKVEIKLENKIKSFLTACAAMIYSLLLVSTGLSASEYPNKTMTVKLRAGTDLTGTLIDLKPDSLTLETEHGDVVLRIRDIEPTSWEIISQSNKKTSPSVAKRDKQTRKKLVSEILENTPKEVEPDFPSVSLRGIKYDFRKSFSSDDKTEFIYSPEGQTDFKIAKDNLTIWIIDNTSERTAAEITTEFIERFGNDKSLFKTEQIGEETLFYGSRTRKKDSDPRYLVGKTCTDGTTAWIIVHSHSNSEGELKGWKTDQLEEFLTEIKNFNEIPDELIIQNE
jgi:hypothetical protein